MQYLSARKAPSILVVTLSAVVLGAGVGAAPSALNVRDLRVEQLWRTDGSDSQELGPFVSIEGMIEDGAGRVWVSDSPGATIRIIGPGGASAGTIARQGDGPGEVRSPTLLTESSDGRIMVYDVGRAAIDVFSPSGDFDRRVRLPLEVMWVKAFAVLRSGAFVLSGGIVSSDRAIHMFDGNGGLVRSWGETPLTEDPQARWIVSGGPVTALEDGSLLYSQAAPLAILRYSAESGGPADTVYSDPDLLPPVGDDVIVESVENGERVRSFRGAFPQSKGVFRLPDGNFLNVAVFAERGLSHWLVVRPDGTPVANASIPLAYTPWSLAHEGRILASYLDPVTQEVFAVKLGLDY